MRLENREITFKERDELLKKLCTDRFLSKLTRVARLYGWEGDYREIRGFLEYLFVNRDKTVPEIEPFDVRD